MTRWQILSLLRDYVRNMLFAGKTVKEAEGFLHVLRAYITEKEFWELFKELKNLESDLAGKPREFALPTTRRTFTHFVDTRLWLVMGVLLNIVFISILDLPTSICFWLFWLFEGWALNRWGWRLIAFLRRERRGITPKRHAELLEPRTAVVQFLEFFEEEKATQARLKEERAERLEKKRQKYLKARA